MKINLKEKNAVFLFDKEGVIIIADIEKKKDVIMAELIYDGKNVAILNRNNKEFFCFKNIAPLIREKIKQSKYVTIVEKDDNDLYAYKVEVHLKDDLGFEDNFEEFAQKITEELKKQLTPDEFDAFVKESGDFLQDIEN